MGDGAERKTKKIENGKNPEPPDAIIDLCRFDRISNKTQVPGSLMQAIKNDDGFLLPFEWGNHTQTHRHKHIATTLLSLPIIIIVIIIPMLFGM
jgi:hypothetical protein